MPRSDDTHVRLALAGHRVLIWTVLLLALLGTGYLPLSAGESEQIQQTCGFVGVLVMTVLLLCWCWYGVRRFPAIRAEQRLAPHAAALQLAVVAPSQAETKSIRESLYQDPFARWLKGRKKSWLIRLDAWFRPPIERYLEGRWEGSLVAVRFEAPSGLDNTFACGETRVYLTSERPLRRQGRLAGWRELTGTFSKRALDLRIDGCEVSMGWLEMEKDSAVIAAAFRVLKAVAEVYS